MSHGGRELFSQNLISSKYNVFNIADKNLVKLEMLYSRLEQVRESGNMYMRRSSGGKMRPLATINEPNCITKES